MMTTSTASKQRPPPMMQPAVESAADRSDTHSNSCFYSWCLANTTTAPTTITDSTTAYTILSAVAYTMGAIGAAVVFLWVGVWGLLDHYLFPSNTTLSGVVCLSFAAALATICHATVGNVHLNKDHHHQQQLGVENIHSSTKSSNHGFVLLTALLDVCYWRGVWTLWETLVFPHHPTLQSVLALTLAVFILCVTRYFESTVVGPPILFPRPSSSLPSKHDPQRMIVPELEKNLCSLE